MNDKITINISRAVLNRVMKLLDERSENGRTITARAKAADDYLTFESAIAETDAKSKCFKCHEKLEYGETEHCDSCEHWFCQQCSGYGCDCTLCIDCGERLAKEDHA